MRALVISHTPLIYIAEASSNTPNHSVPYVPWVIEEVERLHCDIIVYFWLLLTERKLAASEPTQIETSVILFIE